MIINLGRAANHLRQIRQIGFYLNILENVGILARAAE